MPINCQFHLTRSSPVYYTGEQITGSITLSSSKKPTTVESIKIALLGQGQVSWAIPTISTNIEHNDSAIENKGLLIKHTNTNDYLNESYTLPGPHLLNANMEPITIKFNFILPANLPATIKLPHGEISYALQVQIERKGKSPKLFKNKLIIKNCLVLGRQDLEPVRSKSGTDYTLSLLRGGYMPGQKLNYQLHFSQVFPNKFVVRLCQCIEYRSQLPQAKLKRTTRILDAKRQTLRGQLHLPLTTPVMSLYAHDLIQIEYFLEALIFEQTDAAPIHLFLPIKVCGSVAPQYERIEKNYNFNVNDSDEGEDQFCFINFASQYETQENSCRTYREIGDDTLSISAYNIPVAKRCDRTRLLHLNPKPEKHTKSVLRCFYRGLM